jgi:hypothetical protein
MDQCSWILAWIVTQVLETAISSAIFNIIAQYKK